MDIQHPKIKALNLLEIDLISIDEFSSKTQPSQAAYLSGLIRSTRCLAAVKVLKVIEEIEQLDMTTYLALKISKAIWGINFPNSLFNTEFGTKGRSASNKSKDFERVQAIVNQYKNECLEYTNLCLENCRINYRQTYKLAGYNPMNLPT